MYRDLVTWYPKVRPGGLLSGDDYGDERDSRLMTASRWRKKFGGMAMAKENRWGVITALKRFTEEYRLVLHVTWSTDCYPFPAWYLVKPY